MAEFTPESTSEFIDPSEREIPEIVLEMLPGPEEKDDKNRTITLRTAYQGSEGDIVPWECSIPMSLFETACKTAEKPKPLPEKDKTSLSVLERANWDVVRASHDFRFANSRLLTTLYVTGLLGQSMMSIDDQGVRDQIINQMVNAAEQANEDRKSVE